MFGPDPGQDKFAQALAILGSTFQDAGAHYQGRPSNALPLLLKKRQEQQQYQALQNAIMPQPPSMDAPIEQRAQYDMQQSAPGGMAGGLPPQLAQLLPALGPELGTQLLMSQFKPKEDFTLTEGGQRYGANGALIASNPKAQKYGEKSIAVNPATGKPEIAVLDEQGNPKFTGLAPPPEIMNVNGQLVDKNAATPGTVIPQQLTPGMTPQAEAQRVRIAQAGVDARNSAAEASAHYDMNDPGDKAYIDSIANYRVRPPSAGRNPIQRKAAIEAALKANPDYNEGLYDQSAMALRDFGTGKQGDIARSLNVSVAHLETLRDLGRALDNGDINLVNAVKQRFAEEFGVPAPTNFDTAKSIVADEVAKGVIGGQTAQSDRETLAASLRRSRSFGQIDGAITTFQSLLGGQLGGLRSQYKRTTRANDFDETFLSDATRRALSASENKAQGGAGQQAQSFKSMNDVAAAYKAGQLSRDQAAKILREQFGAQ